MSFTIQAGQLGGTIVQVAACDGCGKSYPLGCSTHAQLISLLLSAGWAVTNPNTTDKPIHLYECWCPKCCIVVREAA